MKKFDLSRESKIFILIQSILFFILIASISLMAIFNSSIFSLGPIFFMFAEIAIFLIGYKVYIESEKERAEEQKKLKESGADIIEVSYKEYIQLIKKGFIEKDGELISIEAAVPQEEKVDKRDISWMSKDYILKEN